LRETDVKRLSLAFCVAAALAAAVSTADPGTQRAHLADQLSGDLTPVHDPSIIKAGDTYYVFSTSQERDKKGLIYVRSSKDLKTWKREPAVFSEIPGWAKREIPGTVGIWAPDASYVEGR
jgi:arabinan endo-1,5-alpha-L-arabinosidase